MLGTGVGAGLAAGLLMLLLRAVQTLAWGAGTGDYMDAVLRASPWRRVAVLAAAGGVVAGARWLLNLRKGGHSGELTAAIWFRAGHMPVLRTVANALISIVIVGMGASLGREAAPKQVGAVLAGVLARWAGLPPARRRLLVACGAGAGMAAVYNVPFGGALFALEVLLGTLSLGLVAPALATSLIATATAWLLLPNRPTYDIPSYPVSASLVAWSLVAGPVIGVAAVGYVRLICWADERKPGGWRMVAAPLAVFAGLGLAATVLPQVLGNGKDAVQAAFTDNGLGLGILLTLAVAKPLATAACLGSGAPGGLFTPTLAFGAVLGLLGGHLAAMAGPAGPLGAYALVGAAAMLAATTQGPVSAVVMMLELTRQLDALMIPLMLAVATAVLAARTLERRSIYSGRIHLGRAAAALAPGETISAAARFPEVLEAVLNQPGRPLHVVDQHGDGIGDLTQADVMRAHGWCGPLEIATARDIVLGEGVSQAASAPKDGVPAA